jgi:hypothetical protein
MRPPKFFKPIFWSYNFSEVDLEDNSRTVIVNTINHGRWKHWAWVINFYGKNKIKEIIENTPRSEFRPPALKLISLLLDIKEMKYASRSDYIRSQKNI